MIAREAGYVDNPADRGGPTKYGITAATLGKWRKLGRAATAAEVQALGTPEAREIYRAMYLTEPKIDQIHHAQLRNVVLDAAVLHGPKTAGKLLQRALGLPDDGIIGSVTLAALPHLGGTALAIAFTAEQARLYGRIISGNLTDADKDGIPDNTEFAAGWLNRLANMMEALL